MALQHLRSSTANKRPTPGAMSDGQLALNTNLASPGLFFKDSNGDSVKIGPVHVGTTAPNVTPGAGGQAGNSKGEAWLDTSAANPILKVFNGSAFVAVQPVGTGTVVSTTDTGTVTSTMILDGTILNADINASAAIVDTKLDTIATAGKVSGTAITSGNISTSGSFTSTSTVTGTNLIPTGSGVPTNGIYLPAANSVAVATNGAGRLFIDASGNVGIGSSSPNTRLEVASSISTVPAAEDFTTTVGYFNNTYDNGTNGTTAYTVLRLRRDGVTGVSYGNSADFGIARYEAVGSNSRSRLDIRLGHGLTNTTDTTVMSLLSSGAVGIGSTAPQNKLVVSNAGAEGVEVRPGDTSNAVDFLVYNRSTAAYSDLQILAATHRWFIAGNEAARIDSAGRVGIGTTSPGSLLHLSTAGASYLQIQNTTAANSVYFGNSSGNGIIQVDGANSLSISTNGSERCRVDSSGRLLIGTSSNTASNTATFQGNSAAATGGSIIQLRRGEANPGAFDLGTIQFADSAGGIAATILGSGDGTWGSNDYPGRLVFSTTADGASSPTERMRITSGGEFLFGKTTNVASDNGAIIGGQYFSVASQGFQGTGFHRNGNDGGIIGFFQDGTEEGSISVSGTTVSYNGAHLSRWSQLPSGAERIEILRGTVLSNLDEMCEWGEEDNEQLNRMKVSDVEGDKNVSGVFQAWDDDDDTYTDDFYCAMTGDFIIRIAEGTTVERGDLLMSAGDGTAKPQDDDIIRSKTIAKVTSTNVSCTYPDGSYCVPCVLMAC
jgi:hypothetical protein